MKFFLMVLAIVGTAHAKAPHMQGGGDWKSTVSQRELASNPDGLLEQGFAILCKPSVHELNNYLIDRQKNFDLKLKYVSAPSQVFNEVCVTFRVKSPKKK